MGMAFRERLLRAYFIAGTQDVKNPRLTLQQILQQALAAGITAFQYREKGPGSLTGKARVKMALQLQEMCASHAVPFIADDDVDLAKTTDADGIHVGQKDERVTQVIDEVGDSMFVGLSCDTEDQVRAANQTSGLSYIGSGPVYPTGSKADADPAIGVDGLAKLVAVSQLPVVAIGGITEENVDELPKAKVTGAAVISMIAQSRDINRTVAKMLTTF